MVAFVSTNLETIPNHLSYLVHRDEVSCQLVIIEFEVELFRIKLLPKDRSILTQALSVLYRKCPIERLIDKLSWRNEDVLSCRYRRLSRAFTPRTAPAIIRLTAAMESPPSSVAGIVAKPIAEAFG